MNPRRMLNGLAISTVQCSMTLRHRASDAFLAVLLSAISLSLLASLPELRPTAIAFALMHTLPITLRRQWPLPAAAFALAAALVYAGFGLPVVGLGPAALVWLYTIGAELKRPASLVVFTMAEIGVVFAVGVIEGSDLSTVAGDAVALAVAFLLGDATRRRREVLDLHRERADQLERTQEEATRRAVAEERIRIARDLHDVVAHSMSVIALQASSGRLVLDQDPERARAALEVIERTSRSSLEEMRMLLGVLRDGGVDEGIAPRPGARRPAPDLSSIDELVAATVTSGISVAVRIEGVRRTLPPSLELAGYRIVQEALTNVARHAPQSEATVRLRYEEDVLEIDVTNTTSPEGPASGGAGLGLIGVRERAAAVGGEVDAGPLRSGGYRLRARLPVPSA